MTGAHLDNANEKDREIVRMALVLNGGVSLAVWMAGVVRELEIARRASRREGRPEKDSPERRHYDFWADVFREKNLQVDIDIISGTSAGGLNGTLLASALATGTSLRDLRPMWAESAALSADALLRPSASTPVPSVLDGQYFAKKAGIEVDEATRDGAQSHGLPVTLFVTATALGSADRAYRDSAGTTFTAADHRCVYRFRNATPVRFDPTTGKYTSTDRNDFVHRVDDLKLAARASAGFPVAFEPVQETPAMASDTELSFRRPTGSERKWLIDGGVLDNAPFEAVLKEILSRQLDEQPVHRMIAYIAPSDGRAHTEAATPGEQPVWTKVLSAAQGFPRESDFRDDVWSIDQNLLLAATANRGAESTLNQFVTDTDGALRSTLHSTAVTLFPQYRVARMATAAATVQRRLASEPKRARTLGAPALGDDADPLGDWLSKDLPDSPSRLGLDATERSVRLLMRIARDGRLLEAAKELSVVVTRLSALREAQSKTIVSFAEGGDFPVESLLGGDRFALDSTIGAAYTQLSLWDRLDEQVDRAVAIYATATKSDSERVKAGLVVGEVIAQALSPSLDPVVPPDFTFLRIGPDQESPLVADLTDEVAKRGPLAKLGEDKLFGTQLNHFGAFGRREWRDNDWLWGRLDGAAHLARNLRLEPQQVRKAQELALGSEGFSTDTLLEGLRQLGNMEGQGLIDELRRTDSGRTSIELVYDAAIRLLGATSPQLPEPLQKQGPRFQAAFQLNDPPEWPAGTSLKLKAVLGGLGWYAKRKVKQWTYELEDGTSSPGLWTRIKTLFIRP